jgi:hypothetical protein
MPLVDFKIAIADALFKARKTVTPKRGHSSNGLQQKIDEKKRRGLAAEMPQAEVRQAVFCLIQLGKTHMEDANYPTAKRNLL